LRKEGRTSRTEGQTSRKEGRKDIKEERKGGGSRKRGGEGRGVKKKLKAKHVKPKQNVHGKITPTTHTPLTFPGK
jgi:hypothetical protein